MRPARSFVLALALFCSAVAARDLQQGPPATIVGTIAVLSIDGADQSEQSMLILHTPDGRQVPIDADAAQLPPGLRSGDSVWVDGWWRSRGQGAGDGQGDGGSFGPPGKNRGCAHSQNCLRPRSIGLQRRHQDGDRPVVWQAPADSDPASQSAFLVDPTTGTAADSTTTTPASTDAASTEPAASSSAAVTAAAAAAATAPVVRYINNTLVTAYVDTLIVPIAAVTAACLPGSATCYTSCPGITTQPPLTRALLQRKVFSELVASNVATVGGMFNRCSYSRTKMTYSGAGSSNVTDIVKLPCSGTSDGIPWSTASCSFDDFNGLASAANDKLRAQGVPVDRYKYKVYLMPPGMPCGWVGLGYVGCDGSYECRAWITGEFWSSPQAIAHELGHNLFMAHANKLFTATGAPEEYGDDTCMMGYCCLDRCWNTPHAWQAGWLNLRHLTAADLPLNTAVAFTVLVQSSYQTSGLRLDTSTWAPAVPPIFVGYRKAQLMDAWLATSGTNRLADMIHIYTSTVGNTFDPEETVWRDALVVNDYWTLPAAGITIRRVYINSTIAAAVVITRTAISG